MKITAAVLHEVLAQQNVDYQFNICLIYSQFRALA